MLEWSKFFQTPKYLDLYRQMTMNEDFKPLISKWIGLKDNMKILDVGCGTGAFCFYLSTETKNSAFTGIDIDKTFISEANKKVNIDKSTNYFEFCVGDALELPFEDNTFDIVISYTVLTNLPNGSKALKEMVRVLKPGGSVISVTAQSLQYFPAFEGVYPSSFSYYPEYKYYRNKVNRIYETIQPQSDYIQYGTLPEKIPLLFSQSSLREIKIHPIGYAFSLSNAIYTEKQKETFIQDMYVAEVEKFHNYLQLPIFREYYSDEDIKKYEFLLNEHKNVLLTHLDENCIWEWFGGAQLLVQGKK